MNHVITRLINNYRLKYKISFLIIILISCEKQNEFSGNIIFEYNVSKIAQNEFVFEGSTNLPDSTLFKIKIDNYNDTEGSTIEKQFMIKSGKFSIGPIEIKNILTDGKFRVIFETLYYSYQPKSVQMIIGFNGKKLEKNNNIVEAIDTSGNYYGFYYSLEKELAF